MKRHCPCGKSWEGEGACPACAVIAAAKIERIETNLGSLREGFASLIKIAADTPTAAPKPPGIGPLMSAAWRIRQLGKERVAAMKKADSLEEGRPYWLWHALLVEASSDPCLHEDEGECLTSGKCITEYCNACAAAIFLSAEKADEAE